MPRKRLRSQITHTRLVYPGGLPACSRFKHALRSVVDHTAAADLAKVTVDLRQGTGPLKLGFQRSEAKAQIAVDVELVMVEFGELQAGVHAATNPMVYWNRCESALRQLRAVFTGFT